MFEKSKRYTTFKKVRGQLIDTATNNLQSNNEHIAAVDTNLLLQKCYIPGFLSHLKQQQVRRKRSIKRHFKNSTTGQHLTLYLCITRFGPSDLHRVFKTIRPYPSYSSLINKV